MLSLTIFLQFTVAAVILCVCMLNIFIFADASHQAITIVYYVCVMLQTLPACYQASMLKADSTNLPNAIFHCNWLAFDKRSRRLLIYFLHRAQEEISFLAAKLFEINLGTNLSVSRCDESTHNALYRIALVKLFLLVFLSRSPNFLLPYIPSSTNWTSSRI